MLARPQPIYLVDLDGTLSDTRHRDHYVRGPFPDAPHQPDWDAYYAAAPLDPPFPAACALAAELGTFGSIYIWSDRVAPVSVTRRWLHVQGVPCDDLRLRAADDHRTNAALKRDWLLGLPADERARVVCLIDDHPATCAALSREGVLVLRAHPVPFTHP